MKIKVLIVDDEPAAVEGMILRLRPFEDLDIVASASCVEQAIVLYCQYEPDLVFLDVEMPGGSGFKFSDYIQRHPEKGSPAIVFVTAYQNYAVSAFDSRAVDYLVKPVNQNRLDETITRVREYLQNKPSSTELLGPPANASSPVRERKGEIEECTVNGKLKIKIGRENVIFIDFDKILWIDAAGDYMCVHTSAETYIMRVRLKDLVSGMLPDSFVRVHKSTVINIHQLKKLEPLQNSKYLLVLENDKEIRVSRTYSKVLREKLASNFQ